MVDALFLVTRTAQGVGDDRNRVREVVIFNDDGDSDLVIAQNTVDILNTNTPTGDGLPAHDVAGENVYPDLYFDTVVQIGTIPSGPFGTEFDYIAYAPKVDEFTA